MLKKPFFLSVELKIRYKQTLTFVSFMNKVLIFLLQAHRQIYKKTLFRKVLFM